MLLWFLFGHKTSKPSAPILALILKKGRFDVVATTSDYRGGRQAAAGVVVDWLNKNFKGPTPVTRAQGALSHE